MNFVSYLRYSVMPYSITSTNTNTAKDPVFPKQTIAWIKNTNKYKIYHHQLSISISIITEIHIKWFYVLHAFCIPYKYRRTLGNNVMSCKQSIIHESASKWINYNTCTCARMHIISLRYSTSDINLIFHRLISGEILLGKK